jgi:Holliday junction resolvase
VGARSRRTGATFEREVRKLLEQASGVPWIRTDGGRKQIHGDVMVRGDAPAPWGALFIECKAHASVDASHLLWPSKQILDWWEIATAQAREAHKAPCLFLRFRQRGLVLVTMGEALSLIEQCVSGGDGWQLRLGDAWGAYPYSWAVDAKALLGGGG